MICKLLSRGEKNAVTASELCTILGIGRRSLIEQVKRERRAGLPICASCNNANPGYFLAESQEEMQAYCNSLSKRAEEIELTRQACLNIIPTLPNGGAK